MAKIKAGDKFPNFEFKTAYREGLHVYDVLKGKTIFWVLRYIGCTSCNFDVAMIAADYDKFTAKNAQVFVVMQSDQAHLKADLEKRPLPFDIISDDKMEIYKALEIKAAETKEGLAPAPKDAEKFAENGRRSRRWASPTEITRAMSCSFPPSSSSKRTAPYPTHTTQLP